jgi:hypothetical protein
MRRYEQNILQILAKKIAVLSLIAISAVGAFATLGDGNKKSSRSLLSTQKTNYKPGSFSLRSGYNFRGNQVLSNTSTKKYISINTTVMAQRGNSTVLVPLKKNVLVGGTGGVKFNISRH